MSRRPPRPLLLVLTAALALGAPACSTILQASDRDGPAAMGGVRAQGWAWSRLLDAEEKPLGGVVVLSGLLVLDFPLSLAADLLLLPYGIYNELDAGGLRPRWPELFDWRT